MRFPVTVSDFSAPTPTESCKQTTQGDTSSRSPVCASDSNPAQDSGSNHVSPHPMGTDANSVDRTNKGLAAGDQSMEGNATNNIKSKSKHYEVCTTHVLLIFTSILFRVQYNQRCFFVHLFSYWPLEQSF